MDPIVPPAIRPPFVLRARILTPLTGGGSRYEPDGFVEVGADGRIVAVGAAGGGSVGDPALEATRGPVIDLRPMLLLPGMVDLHAHLPQLPNAGLGAGLDLLTWLERYIFPMEREFDEAHAERLAPAAFRAFAAAGTTTAVIYTAVYEPSTEVTFRAAEAHGLRAVIGKVMMDRLSYDDRLAPADILETSLRQSADLCSRWHGRDDGRLRYAFTPRFAVSCSADMLRESARLAAETGAYWQTHLSEDRGELAEVARLFPEATDYLDVYDRAGGLGARTILAHAIHCSEREVARLAESGLACRALPGFEPVPGLGRDAAGSLPRCGRVGRPGVRRRRRAGAVDLRGHARWRLHAERPAGPRGARDRRIACARCSGARCRGGDRVDAARLAASRDPRRGARAWASTT